MLKLIVNADDFGWTETINHNIIRSHREGIVTSATLLAGGGAFEHAVQLAKENPQLAIGAHLAIDDNLNIGKSYKTLTDPETGHFYDQKTAIRKILSKKFSHNELVAEYSLQVEKILDAGFELNHLDHHNHLHKYIPVLKAIIEVAKKYKIAYIRPQKMILLHNQNVLKRMYRSFHHRYLEKRHLTLDGFICLNGCENKKDMIEKLRQIVNLKKMEVELVVHASNDYDELEFLTHLDARELAQQYLTTYSELFQKKTETVE